MPKNVLSDREIEFSSFYSHKTYPERLRMVRYWNEDDQREFTFLTNAKHISAIQVACLYKTDGRLEYFPNGSSSTFESINSGYIRECSQDSSLYCHHVLLPRSYHAARYATTDPPTKYCRFWEYHSRIRLHWGIFSAKQDQNVKELAPLFPRIID